MEGLWPVVTKQESDMICTAVPKQPETPVSSKTVRVENMVSIEVVRPGDFENTLLNFKEFVQKYDIGKSSVHFFFKFFFYNLYNQMCSMKLKSLFSFILYFGHFQINKLTQSYQCLYCNFSVLHPTS